MVPLIQYYTVQFISTLYSIDAIDYCNQLRENTNLLSHWKIIYSGVFLKVHRRFVVKIELIFVISFRIIVQLGIFEYEYVSYIQGSVNRFCTIDNTKIYLMDTKVVILENMTQTYKIKNILFNVASITCNTFYPPFFPRHKSGLIKCCILVFQPMFNFRN